jgi:integrase
MNDILIPWKKITRGLPKGRKYAYDRAPTIEDIKRIIEYPDRRIKAIVCTMSSSGIRLGAWDYLRWKDIQLYERVEKL